MSARFIFFRTLPLILFCILSLSLSQPKEARAAVLEELSDLISTSETGGTTTTHRIRFLVPTTIPPSGKIVIAHDGDAFTIPLGLDDGDIDLAVAPASVGPYVDRTLGGAASPGVDGVSVVSGANGSITFTLDPTSGITAGEYVEIEIGDNATFQGTGDNYLVSPSVVNSYRVRIRTLDAGNVLIDYGTAMFAIVDIVTVGPVDTNDPTPPLRTNGLPSGAIPGTTVLLEISLNTDKFTTCKYATTSGMSYSAMPNTFARTVSTVHRQLIAVTVNTSYNFYVRCKNQGGGEVENADDYPIIFSVGGTDVSTTPPTPIGRSGQGGGGLNGGQYLGKADVTIDGRAYPLANVVILNDGKIEREVQASNTGVFNTIFYGYERGAHTFSYYAEDPQKKKSSTYSSTVYLIANTNNFVGPIYLSPTVTVAQTTVAIGETLAISGYAIPTSVVEVFIERQAGKGDGTILRATTTPLATGVWTLNISTEGLARGTYQVKAHSIISERDQSNFSPYVYVGVGEDASPDFGLRADLNKDKKVNLVDFSILLFNWKTADDVADINQDGDVNLTDFSILVFYWTG